MNLCKIMYLSPFSAYQTAFGGGGGSSGGGSSPSGGASVKTNTGSGPSGVLSNGGSAQIPNITAPLNATMNANASNPLIQNPFYFKNKVQTGGEWDIKNTPGGLFNANDHPEGFIYEGKKIRSDAPGNLQYGFVGAGTWYGDPKVLLTEAGANQVQNNEKR